MILTGLMIIVGLALAAAIVLFSRPKLLIMFALIILMADVALISGKIVYDSNREITDAATVCENNAISYTLCKTIAEYTGENELDVAYFLEYCGKAKVDLMDAVAMVAPDLTETEIVSVLVWSDKRQQDEDAQEVVPPPIEIENIEEVEPEDPTSAINIPTVGPMNLPEKDEIITNIKDLNTEN